MSGATTVRFRTTLGTLAALVVVACGPPPTPSPAPTLLATPGIEAAALTVEVTRPGEFCGPWWMGCGAYLTVQPAGWTKPDAWTPAAGDTQFEGKITAGDDRPARITGVGRPGRDRIDPGDYGFLVIETTTGDTMPSPPMTSTVRCATRATVPSAAREVHVRVAWSNMDCTIEVAIEPVASRSLARPRIQAGAGSGLEGSGAGAAPAERWMITAAARIARPPST